MFLTNITSNWYLSKSGLPFDFHSLFILLLTAFGFLYRFQKCVDIFHVWHYKRVKILSSRVIRGSFIDNRCITESK